MTTFLTEVPGLLADNSQAHGAKPTSKRVRPVDNLDDLTGWSFTDAFLPPSSADLHRGASSDAGERAVVLLARIQ